tara:strand:- start:656 stop:1030 length:375 start_codon:yes stop_codon:yes gene_type:complete
MNLRKTVKEDSQIDIYTKKLNKLHKLTKERNNCATELHTMEKDIELFKPGQVWYIEYALDKGMFLILYRRYGNICGVFYNDTEQKSYKIEVHNFKNYHTEYIGNIDLVTQLAKEHIEFNINKTN